MRLRHADASGPQARWRLLFIQSIGRQSEQPPVEIQEAAGSVWFGAVNPCKTFGSLACHSDFHNPFVYGADQETILCREQGLSEDSIGNLLQRLSVEEL